MAHLLIIEDDPEAARILEMSLKREGYRVTVAMNGVQGLNTMQTQQIDLVLLDLMMPGMDGYEVCRQTRADSRTATLPLVVVSARTQEADKQRAFRVGANSYLTKPYRRADLLAEIQKHLPAAS